MLTPVDPPKPVGGGPGPVKGFPAEWVCHTTYGQRVYVRKSDGALYEGNLHEGRPSGRGTCRWPSGRMYAGEFKEGQPHGEGVLHGAEGSTCAGTFAQGAPQGVVTLRSKAGEVTYQGDISGFRQRARPPSVSL